MRKLFSINSNQAPILVTLFTVILLGVIYLFVYIPQNEKELKEQRFRAMQRIDDNVHAKINNSTALMDGLLKASFNPKITDSLQLQQYIKSYDKNNFTLFPIEGALDTAVIKQAQKKKITPIFSDTEDGVSALRVNDTRRQFKLYYAKRFSNKASGDSCYYMSMLYNFDDFIKPLLPANVFDEYVVFSKGNVVYESFPSGLSYAEKDSLLGVRNGVAGSAIRDQAISGIDYKMFLQPVGFDSTNEWIIAGLLSADRYDNEKKQLPASLAIFLMIIGLTIVISLPWIKLYHMGSRDRLTLLDGSLSFFVAMLLISMLFFAALWAGTQLYETDTVTSEKNLAANIETAFNKEIDIAYREIRSLDSLMFTDTLRTSIISLGKDARALKAANIFNDKRYGISGSSKAKNVSSLLNKTININHAFWLNNKGDDIYYWTKDTTYPPPGNFSKRYYFKNIAENDPLLLHKDNSKPFYIEQLVSWTAGTFRTVISIPSKMKGALDSIPAVAALSVNIKSLDSVIMPAGYQFAITNEKGEVLYHYNKAHNLNENLIAEFSEKAKLRGSYEAHAAKDFTTDYYGKRFHVYTTPIKELPYFLVVLADKTYADTRDVQVFGVTLSLVFIVFLFQLIELTAIVLVIIFSKNSSFKSWSLAASWLWPKKSAHDEYILSMFYNIVIVVLQIYFFIQSSFVENCFMLLPGISLMTICFHALFVKRYQREGKYVYARNKIKIIICMSVFMLVLNVLAWYVLDRPYGNFLCFQLSAIFFSLLFIFWGSDVIYLLKKRFPVTRRSRWNYINSYALMAVTRFIISSGIPVVLFYISSFNYEQSLLAHHKHIEFAKSILKKNPGFNSTKNVQASYKDSIWVQQDLITPVAGNFSVFSSEDSKAMYFLNAFRFYNNDISGQTQYLNEVKATDSSYFSGNFFNHERKRREEVSTSVRIEKTGKYLQIRSAPLFYNFTRIKQAAVIWLLLVAILALFYLAIYKIIKKIFALDLPNIGMWHKIDKDILQRNELNKYVLIIGAPGSGKLKSLMDKIENKKIVYKVDLINIPVNTEKVNDDNTKKSFGFDFLFRRDIKKQEENTWKDIKAQVKKDQYKLIIVDHFGYNMHHIKTNCEKLAFLEDLMATAPDKKIIILSTVHPYAFLDSLNAQQPEEANNIDFNLQRWTEVLGHYRIVIYPLEQTDLHKKGKKLKKLISELEGLPKEKIIIGTPQDKITIIEKLNLVSNQLETLDSVIFIGRSSKKTVEDHHKYFRNDAIAALKYIASMHTNNATPNRIDIPTSDYELLLGEAKRLLKEMISFTKDEYSESGQKILRETQHTHFLNKLQQPISEIAGNVSNKVINSDSLALKIQLTSQHFYMYLWNSLTKEEKFILYDLAEDGLVNTHDTLNLTMLTSKGLIQRDAEGALRIFNKSFRNFIISSIGYTESNKLKKEIKESGDWNKLRTPLVIIIIAIFSLLIISQKEVYTKVIGYLTVLVTAVIPLLQRAFALFEKGNTKS